MAKRNEEQIQNPEEEQLENISQEVDEVNGGEESVIDESPTEEIDTPEENDSLTDHPWEIA